MTSRRPVALAALAGIGFVVSAYLAAFQIGLVGHVWDPLFGTGSERVLHSGISRLLPIPDAAMGAGAYALDAALALALAFGLGERSIVVTALAVVATLGGAVAVVLVALQPIVAGTFCSLCLTSAAMSVVLAAGALAEVRTVRRPRARRTRAVTAPPQTLERGSR